MEQLKIALIGKKAAGRTFAAFYLNKKHGFKMMRAMDAVAQYMRKVYIYPHKGRPSWERKYDIYDALYRIDPDIHVDHLLWKIHLSSNHIVVDDIRYISELQKLVDDGFLIVRVAMPERKRRKLAALRQAETGTVLLTEEFGHNFTEAYQADYSLYNETKDGTRIALDRIVEKEIKLLDPEHLPVV